MRRLHHIRFYLRSMTLHEGGTYEIRLGAHLDDRWAAAFDGLELTHESDGTTTLYGSVIDQAALHGVLSRVRDLAVPLISVNHVDPGSRRPAWFDEYVDGGEPA